ncbi:MAG: hypothetical protein KJ886_02455 [Candidatus Thermoplasmatota archaeon]|nr:hypothetical protein [Candidatus Thermoplasmatota archaeon]MCG2825450.1 hypothetical protein [Thermoplasmatales archaeon]
MYGKSIRVNLYLIKKLQRKLLVWFEKNGRKFPWREPHRSPYEIFVAEMMLQKTRAEGIVDVYLRFIKQYQNIKELAKADLTGLTELLKPLGLYRRRARDMLNLSKIVVEKYQGKLPASKKELLMLPGIGIYIASAFLSVAYNRPLPIVDTNIRRLYSRFFSLNIHKDLRRDKFVWELAAKILPRKNCKEFNWALLDLSAMVCKSKVPLCASCPVREDCACQSV